MKRRLPFSERAEYQIVKPTGKFAHENWLESTYATDFLLELGTPLVAAEDGTVAIVKNDSTTAFLPDGLAGLDENQIKNISKKYTNYVGIRYVDGRYAEFLHIGKDVLVAEGDKVRKDQEICYVGMNGITSEPHLHYNEFKIIWFELIGNRAISMPVEFE